MSVNVFVPLMKVDEARREVWGRATQEVVDKSGEIFDYETSKPYFKAWSDEIAKASDGKSLGNIRAMHGKTAAGKIIAMDFNDAEKAIDIGTKIVDDNEWNKVLEGVYTGFSIGGAYVKRWKDGDAQRFTAKPSETSLVDNPCVPTAKFFDVVKADGQLAKVAFQEPVKKGLAHVSWAADLLASLDILQQCVQAESAEEGDASPIPAQLKAVVSSMADALRALVTEETEELMAGVEVDVLPDGSMAMASKSPLRKVGARNSAKDKDHLQAIHDHASAMGADCPGKSEEGDSKGDDKGDESEKLAKAAEAHAVTKASLTDALAKVEVAEAALAKANARVAELEAQPETPKGVAMVVAKGTDSAMAREETRDTDIQKAVASGDPVELIKVIHQYGAQPVR